MRPNRIRIEGQVAFPALNRDLTARLDAAAVPLVIPYRWTARWERRPARYAVFTLRPRPEGGGKAAIALHRFIVAPPPNMPVRFRTSDGLDFRRANLDAGAVPDGPPPPNPVRVEGDMALLTLDGGREGRLDAVGALRLGLPAAERTGPADGL